MDTNRILTLIIGISLFLFLVTVIALLILQRKTNAKGALTGQARGREHDFLFIAKQTTRLWLINLYQKSYVWFIRTPVLHGYVLKIRKRLSNIHAYDEYRMRQATMKITLLTLLLVGGTLTVLLLLNQDLTFTMMSLIAVFVLHGLVIDTFINRIDDRLLKQLSHLMTDVRHHYHQHGMVEEAIYEAAQISKYEAAMHAEKIYDMLTANDPQEELENYYETAPNRFLKAFAGLSYLIKEYGDKTLAYGSLYLNALTRLTHEINMEILRRERLSYLFRGLTVIALSPLLFAKPLENWASAHFTAMNDFYDGRLGMITRIVVFAVILISYILLRKMQENDEGKYAAQANFRRWEQKVYEVRWIRWVVDRFVPGVHTRQHFVFARLLKDTNSQLTIEWVTLQRLLLGVSGLLLVIGMFFYLHHASAQNVLYAPTKSTLIFGQLSPEELQKAQVITDADRLIIETVANEQGDVRERVEELVRESAERGAEDEELRLEADRIMAKIEQLDDEYFKWWELLIACAVYAIGYYAPVWVIYFNKRLREMDMQNEVDQFHTLIAILCEFERISVENIIEWLESFAVVFKRPMQECLLHYEGGAEQALEQLKEEVTFVPFVRTIERLQVAVEKIPIRQAFDDLEAERLYYMEQRKQQNEKVINEKVGWGKMIGFVPMYALVFLYLVIPLIAMSMMQMTDYVDQIRTISR